jgi:hypothetical protein
MKVFKVLYTWEDPASACESCLGQGTPHIWTCHMQVKAAGIVDAADRAEQAGRESLLPGTKYTITSLALVGEGEVTPWESSPQTEAEALGLGTGGSEAELERGNTNPA